MVNKNQSSFAERLIRRSLTSLGATFDGLFSSKSDEQKASTAELVEQMKSLLDKNIREERGEAIAPHLVRVRIEWGKLETADEHPQLREIRAELLAALITHINDNRYHVYGTPQVEVKPDMLIKGLKMTVGFDVQDFQSGEAGREKVITLKKAESNATQSNEAGTMLYAELQTTGGVSKNISIPLKNGQRVSVGRGKDNDLYIADQSVSKIHAALVFDAENNLKLADTGSTNGTFINGTRISYGKASVINEKDEIKFGDVTASFRVEIPPVVVETPAENLYQKPTNAPEGFQIIMRDSRQIEAAQEFNTAQWHVETSAVEDETPPQVDTKSPSEEDFATRDKVAVEMETALRDENLPDEIRAVIRTDELADNAKTTAFNLRSTSEELGQNVNLPPTEELSAPSDILAEIRAKTEKKLDE